MQNLKPPTPVEPQLRHGGEAITVVWVFETRKNGVFTTDQILSLVDGLDGQTLHNAFHDVHIDGAAFASWYRRQAAPPCTLKADFVGLIRRTLAAAGKTLATIGDHEVFLFRMMAQYWRFPIEREEHARKEKEAQKRDYFALLSRLEELGPGESKTLARLMIAIPVSDQRLSEDVKIIQEARQLTAIHSQWKRFTEALGRLNSLAKLRPDFFNTAGVDPCLAVAGPLSSLLATVDIADLDRPAALRPDSTAARIEPAGDAATPGPVDEEIAGSYRRAGPRQPRVAPAERQAARPST